MTMVSSVDLPAAEEATTAVRSAATRARPALPWANKTCRTSPTLILVILSAAKDLTERSDTGRMAGVRSFAEARRFSAPLRTTGSEAVDAQVSTRKLTCLDAVRQLKRARLAVVEWRCVVVCGQSFSQRAGRTNGFHPPSIRASVVRRRRAGGPVEPRRRARLSLTAGTSARGIRRRRRARHHRAADRQVAGRTAGPAVRHREQARRERPDRDRRRRQGAPDGYTLLQIAQQQHRRCGAQGQAALRLHPRHRPGRRRLSPAAGHGSPSLGARDHRCRVHRAGQVEARQDQHGVGRRRHRHPSRRRAVPARRPGSRCSTSPIAACRRCATSWPARRIVYFGVVASSLPQIKAGKLRALAVTTATRSPVLPDVPAMAEFLPGYEFSAWYGLGAPKGTPAGRHRAAEQGGQRGPGRSAVQRRSSPSSAAPRSPALRPISPG